MMAIITRFHPCTAVKGARYSATAGPDRVWNSDDDRLNSQGNHAAVLVKLCHKFGWYGKLVCGEIIDRDDHPESMVWVFVQRHRDKGTPIIEVEVHVVKEAE